MAHPLPVLTWGQQKNRIEGIQVLVNRGQAIPPHVANGSGFTYPLDAGTPLYNNAPGNDVPMANIGTPQQRAPAAG